MNPDTIRIKNNERAWKTHLKRKGIKPKNDGKPYPWRRVGMELVNEKLRPTIKKRVLAIEKNINWNIIKKKRDQGVTWAQMARDLGIDYDTFLERAGREFKYPYP